MQKNSKKMNVFELNTVLMMALVLFLGIGAIFVKAASPNNSTPILFPLDGFPVAVNSNTPITYQLSAYDPDFDALTFGITPQLDGANIDSQTGLFTWNPVNIQPGQYTLNFSVSDGIDTAFIPVDVVVSGSEIVTNQAPVLSAISDMNVISGQTISFSALASDPNNDPLIFIYPNGLPSGATLNIEGVFSWTPLTSQVGNYTISITVSDGSLSDTKSFVISVTNPVSINHAPILTTIGDKTATVGQKLSFQIIATDQDNDTLNFSSQNSLPLGASLDSKGFFSWTPSSSQIGSFNFSVIVSDGKLTDTKSFAINVKSAESSGTSTSDTSNKPPVISSISPQYVKIGDKLKFTVIAKDPNNDPLKFSASNLPKRASFSYLGEFKWEPSSWQVGKYTVKINVSDGKVTVSKYVEINVVKNYIEKFRSYDEEHD